MDKRTDSGRIILHIDFDSFFASVEQQCNPLLRNRPIGVTATNGRTCIIASSREAKRLGIKTGTRSYDAFRICPELQLVGADFTKYWEISKKFISICKDFSPFVEVFSIDELFMDVTLSAHLYGGPESLVEVLKQRIRIEIGEVITVSVGIAPNKLLAKLASGLKKPNGMFRVYPHHLESVYRIAELQDICGIGPRIEARLRLMGVRTLLQLRKTPLSTLVSEFGNVEGHFLYDVGRGIDPRPVLHYSEDPTVKSVGRQYCIPRNIHDPRVILQHVYELYEEVALKLRRLNKKARSSGLWLSGEFVLHGHMTQTTYVDQGADLYRLGMQVLEQKYGGLPTGYVRKIGVWAGYLEDTHNLSLPLLPKDRKQAKLIKVVDQLNDKFGDHTIRNGFLLNAAKLTTVPNGYMADKYERLKLAKTS